MSEIRYSDMNWVSPMCDQYRRVNFDVCRAIDLNALHSPLQAMVKTGMQPEMAKAFDQIATSLRDLIRGENNRVHTIRDKDALLVPRALLVKCMKALDQVGEQDSWREVVDILNPTAAE